MCDIINRRGLHRKTYILEELSRPGHMRVAGNEENRRNAPGLEQGRHAHRAARSGNSARGLFVADIDHSAGAKGIEMAQFVHGESTSELNSLSAF